MSAAAGSPPTPAPAPSWRTTLPAALRRVRPGGSFAIFAVLLVLASLTVENFAAWNNYALIVKQAAIPAIACIGMTVVLMTGGIDLSLGYVVGLCSVLSGMLVKTAGLPVPLAVAATLATGAALGLVNGLVTQVLRVPAFITTLGTGYAIYGLAQIVSQGSIVNRLPPGFLAIGRTSILGLPSAVYLAAAVAAVFYLLINRATFGRRLRAFGHSPRAAALSGVPVGRINVLVYVLCGTLAALSGMLFTIRVNAGQPNMGGGVFTFEVVTAAIVGGTSLFGGVGSVAGSLFGVLSIKIMENCINLLGVSHHLYLAVQGAVILVAIVLGNLRSRSA